MFIRHCQKLDFPTESHSSLEEAYLSLTREDDVRELFETALNSMLNINEILFNEVTEKIVGLTRISPYKNRLNSFRNSPTRKKQKI